MIVVIDGYNLLRSIFSKERGKLDRQRKELVEQLGFYKKQRAEKIKEIVLVFDGGHSTRATREIRHGVTVVFSGQRQDADQWIIDFVERKVGHEIMLVSRDRELGEKCKKMGAEVIKVLDFYKIMQERLLEKAEREMTREVQDSGIKKYVDDKNGGVGEIESEALDLLMRQASMQGDTFVDMYKKEDFDFFEEEDRQKGRSKTPSKKKKKRFSKLKKL